MVAERSEYPGVAPYERSVNRVSGVFTQVLVVWLPVFPVNIFFEPPNFLNLRNPIQTWLTNAVALARELNIPHGCFTDIPYGGEEHQALPHTTLGIIAAVENNRRCGDIFYVSNRRSLGPFFRVIPRGAADVPKRHI
jgi:hypothetical protein